MNRNGTSFVTILSMSWVTTRQKTRPRMKDLISDALLEGTTVDACSANYSNCSPLYSLLMLTVVQVRNFF